MVTRKQLRNVCRPMLTLTTGREVNSVDKTGSDNEMFQDMELEILKRERDLMRRELEFMQREINIGTNMQQTLSPMTTTSQSSVMRPPIKDFGGLLSEFSGAEDVFGSGENSLS